MRKKHPVGQEICGKRRWGHVSKRRDEILLVWLRLFITLDAKLVDEISVAAAVEVGDAVVYQPECHGVVEAVHRLFQGDVLLVGDAGNDACIFHLQYGLSSVHGQSSSAVINVSLLSMRVWLRRQI